MSTNENKRSNSYGELANIPGEVMLRNIGERGYTAVLLIGYHTAVEHLFVDDYMVTTIKDDKELFDKYRCAYGRLNDRLRKDNCQDRYRNMISDPEAGCSVDTTTFSGVTHTAAEILNRTDPQIMFRFLGEKRGYTLLLLTEKNGKPFHLLIDGKKYFESYDTDEVLKKYDRAIHEMWQWVMAIWT